MAAEDDLQNRPDVEEGMKEADKVYYIAVVTIEAHSAAKVFAALQICEGSPRRQPLFVGRELWNLL